MEFFTANRVHEIRLQEHTCSLCDRCILGRDHHCYFAGTASGNVCECVKFAGKDFVDGKS